MSQPEPPQATRHQMRVVYAGMVVVAVLVVVLAAVTGTWWVLLTLPGLAIGGYAASLAAAPAER